jgi:glycosyltransferase involved in cell wall biosynthesis
VTRVLLINQDRIPPYRIPVYNYLSQYLRRDNISLTIVSGGVKEGNPFQIEFDYNEITMSFLELVKVIKFIDPEVVIFWVNLKYLYLFPTILTAKVLGKKVIYWGHGRDLLDINAIAKNIAYAIEFMLSDAIILYASHLIRYVPVQFQKKVFIANNTLNLSEYRTAPPEKEAVLAKYNIHTRKNIICVGRMQKRKRLNDLFSAFEMINACSDLGLILVGPDSDGILEGVKGENIFKLGTMYDVERLELLSAADVFCIPGAVGLSIVDAFFCGVPFVTEAGEESPEIMYLKDGVNGFVVEKDDITQLAAKLKLLLKDEAMREQFSQNAREEIMKNGHIDVLCKGFSDALKYVCRAG